VKYLYMCPCCGLWEVLTEEEYHETSWFMATCPSCEFSPWLCYGRVEPWEEPPRDGSLRPWR
jgi:hypothetical protein